MPAKPLSRAKYKKATAARKRAPEKEPIGKIRNKAWTLSYLSMQELFDKHVLSNLKGRKASVLDMGCGRNGTSPYILKHWLETRGVDHELHSRDILKGNLQSTKGLKSIDMWSATCLFMRRIQGNEFATSFMDRFKLKNKEITGINPEGEPITVPEEMRDEIKFTQEDLLDPNSESEKHDLTICHEVLEHISDAHDNNPDVVNAAFMNLVKKTKTGGHLIVTAVPHEGEGHIHTGKLSEFHSAVDWAAYGLEIVDHNPGRSLLLLRKLKDTLDI